MADLAFMNTPVPSEEELAGMEENLPQMMEEAGAVDHSFQEASPFQDEGSPFGEIDPGAASGETRATPMRTLTAATAMVGADGVVPQSEDELVQMVQRNIDVAEGIIEQNGEYNLRLQTAARQAERRIKALQKHGPDVFLEGGVHLSEEAQKQMTDAYAADQIQHLEEMARTALEEEALQNLETHMAAGDTMAVHVLLNKMDPDKNTTYGVIRDNMVKTMIISNAIEKAELEEGEESLLHSVLTAITSVPEIILLGDMFRKLGNVKDGEAGHKSNFLRGALFPYDDYAEQINALQSMSASELAEYLPKFLENVRGNATTLGMTDPGTVQDILHDFKDSVSAEAMATGNAFHWLDVAGITPFARIGRGAAKTTELVIGVGSRKQAANRVAAAVEETLQNGQSSAVRKYGINVAEAEEHMLPTAINPTKAPDNALTRRAPAVGVGETKQRLLSSTSGAGRPPVPPRVAVSLAGDVSDTMAAARVINTELRAAHNTFRHLDETEIEVAVKAKIKDVEARVGSNIADYEVREVPLESGQVIYQADVVINKPFATAEEAAGYLRSAGYGADVTNAARRGKKLYTDENGNPIRLYHGTTYTDPKLKVGSGEQGTALGKGLYLTADPEYASGYAGKTSYVDKLKAKEEGKTLPDFEEGANVRPVYAALENPYTVTAEDLANKVDVNKKARDLGHDGLLYHTNTKNYEVVVFNEDDVVPAIGEVVEDVSGQFFPRVTVDIGEYGYYTNPLQVPRQFYASRWVLNPSQTSDQRLFEQATKAGQLNTRLLAKINKDLIKAMTKLSRNERTYLDQVILKGTNMKKWFSDGEFRVLWERATGKPPADHVEAAYRQFKVNNDVEWLMRNAQVRTEYVIRGFEDITMPSIAKDPFMGRVQTSGKVPNDRIYNASEAVHIKKGELTQERLDELFDQGYVLVHSEDGITLPDGTEITSFLTKKSDMEVNPIRGNVLEYAEGGHRLYAHKNFVKQARTFKQPDDPNASEQLRRPNVFRTAATAQESKIWAEVMNRARLAVIENGADARFLDTQIFKGQRLDFPTGEEFLKGIDDGTYSLDHPFESVFDRELPSIYSKTADGARFADEDEPGFGGFYRTTGRLYYSRKGDHLRAVDGELSPTLDAFQSQSNALFNVARLSTFSDFKTSAVHRWVNTYKPYLNFDKSADPMEVFNSASISPTLNKSMANQIEGQRNSIKRVLNYRSDVDLHYENMLRGMSEWVAGESDNALRRAVAKAPLYLMDRNPVNYLRGWAFDLKLGLFNIGQFAIQTSTMFSAMALSPRLGARGFLSYMPVQIFHNAKRLGTQDNVLDLMVKRGVHKITGFDNEKEFKDFVKFVSDSGFLDVGASQALINSSNPASTFAILDKVQAGREMGRFFFYQAEVANRIVAMRIAYGEAMERGFKGREFEEFVRGRAENYSFNMSETSRSAWQRGLLSVPTQFWAYNIRMAEALVGKNFTASQKLRLGLMQLGVAGFAGIPMLGWVSDYYNANQGRADAIDTTMGTLQRGLLDRFIYEFSGADIQWGAKWGTGDFFHNTIKDILGIGQYGPKSFADMSGGATYSIWGETIGSAVEVAKYWASHESGGNEVNLSRYEMENLFRQISTVNNVAFKAWFANNYGIYQSVKGRTLVADLPPATGAFIAMGFAPGELRDREAIMAWRENRAESIKTSADFINRLWEESLRQPDKMESNARMVNEFVNMLPADQRTAVLNRVHLNKDPSDYDRLLRLRQTDQIVIDYAKEGNEQ